MFGVGGKKDLLASLMQILGQASDVEAHQAEWETSTIQSRKFIELNVVAMKVPEVRINEEER